MFCHSCDSWGPVQRSEFEAQLTSGFRRLADKGFLNSSSDSLSIRIPATGEMLLATGFENRHNPADAISRAGFFQSEEGVAALHASIYVERLDVGAITISSPRGVKLLAKSGAVLPALFDEQVRHIGSPSLTRLEEKRVFRERIRSTFRRGSNAALLGEQLLCLGMTCERAVFNTELFEKCAQAYVITKASGMRAGVIPTWVRLIANHRLRKDERNAAASHASGRIPDNISGY